MRFLPSRLAAHCASSAPVASDERSATILPERREDDVARDVTVGVTPSACIVKLSAAAPS